MNAAEYLISTFEHPKYGTVPKWVWNVSLTEITREEIAGEFRGFKERDHYAGVMIVLWGNDPEDYLKEPFLRRYRWALEEARAQGLKIFLWDENGFPSGIGGGAFDGEELDYAYRFLKKDTRAFTGGEYCSEVIASRDFAGFLVEDLNRGTSEDYSACYREGRVCLTLPEGSYRLTLFTTPVAPPCQVGLSATKMRLVDYLDHEAVERLLARTYTVYYRHFAEFFGETIVCAFYDEPSIWHVDGGEMWTPSFAEKFAQAHGFSPVPLYLSLWKGPEEATIEDARARALLFGFRSRLYAGEYVGTLHRWCREHRIRLTGHMDQEEIVNPTAISGDPMLVMEQQDIPGVDEISFYGRGACAYKLISSAAENFEKEAVMCEVFGAMGEEMPPEVLRRELVDQCAKGVSLYVPHGTWYSNDPARVTFPPELSYRSERFAAPLREYNDMACRAGALLQGGQLQCDIGVLYPIEDLHAQYWFNGENAYTGGVNPAHSDYFAVAEHLSLKLRRDFVYVHPKALEQRCTVEKGALALNRQIRLRVVIVPGCVFLSCASLRKLAAFCRSGGSVLFTTHRPEHALKECEEKEFHELLYELEHGSPQRVQFLPNPLEELGRALAALPFCPDTEVFTEKEPINGNLSYTHRLKNGVPVWFFGNSGDEPLTVDLYLRDCCSPLLLDLQTGEAGPTEGQQEAYPGTAAQRLHVRAVIPARDGIFIVDNEAR